MVNSDNKYTKMQLDFYNEEASRWSELNREPVVGSFDAHNDWQGYDNLFINIDNPNDKIALDFGCGPGRNLVKYKGLFNRFDGVDMSPINIDKAKQYTFRNGITNRKLYVNNGIDLDVISNEQYDVVFSTICLQHICVYDIRKSYFKEFHRVLKDGGMVTIQMGFGANSPQTVGYYENYYDATGTNRRCDVCIESAEQLEKDLLEIGFKDFKYKLDTTGPGDIHPNWIYFTAIK